jgi:hypothetical protein
VKSGLRRKETQVTGSLARRMLRRLGITRAYVRSIGTQEEDPVRANLPLDYSSWKSIETALLEVERQKAKAITQIRRQQFV